MGLVSLLNVGETFVFAFVLFLLTLKVSADCVRGGAELWRVALALPPKGWLWSSDGRRAGAGEAGRGHRRGGWTRHGVRVLVFST